MFTVEHKDKSRHFYSGVPTEIKMADWERVVDIRTITRQAEYVINPISSFTFLNDDGTWKENNISESIEDCSRMYQV